MVKLSFTAQEVTDNLLNLVQDLVRIKSYSGQEGQIARFIASKMEDLDFDEVKIDRFGNVIGRVGSGDRAILFDSHMDTVAVTDEDEWSVPPFSGEILNGYLWGRGSTDMKSGIAASIYAAARAKSQNLLNGRTVLVSCTVDEEFCDGEGLRYALQGCSKRPEWAVICEPSKNQIVTGHKGKAQMIVRTRGVSAHSSAPEKGVNAVYEMAEIIQRVEQINRKLVQKGGRTGTLSLSYISSTGASLNAVPLLCEIYLDRRLVVGETEQLVRDEMAKIVCGKNAVWEIDTIHRKTWTGEQLTYKPFHLAWELSFDDDLLTALVRSYQGVFGESPGQFIQWDFSTNAVVTTHLGIPTIGYGPGDPKLAHMRDEKCEVSQIIDACKVYLGLINQL